MVEPFHLESVNTEEGTVLMRIQGRLDSASAPILVQKCSAVRSADRNLVLNLSGVTFIASSGVGALLALAEQFHESGRSVRFVALSSAVDSVIRLLNLDQFLPIHATEHEAITALKAA